MKKIESLREIINKMVLDNSLSSEKMVNISEIMDSYLNRYRNLIYSKNSKIKIRNEEKFIRVLKNAINFKTMDINIYNKKVTYTYNLCKQFDSINS